MRLVFSALVLTMAVFTPGWATAQRSGTTYDWQSGSQYQTRQNYDGSSNVRGFNSNTGSMWNTTIKPNGNMHGTDSQGNAWHYDSKSGGYFNSNGTGCFGKGATRTCY